MANIQWSAQPENSQKVDWDFKAKRAGKPCAEESIGEDCSVHGQLP